MRQQFGPKQTGSRTRARPVTAKDAISTLQFAQQWSLDPTGNWSGFQEDANGDAIWDLDQSRSHNPVNEITDITETAGSAWATPAHDRAGNMTTLPQPADPTQTYSGVWDGWNRLVKLVDDGTSNTVQENAYDGRKFRIVRKDYSDGVLDVNWCGFPSSLSVNVIAATCLMRASRVLPGAMSIAPRTFILTYVSNERRAIR